MLKIKFNYCEINVDCEGWINISTIGNYLKILKYFLSKILSFTHLIINKKKSAGEMDHHQTFMICLFM